MDAEFWENMKLRFLQEHEPPCVHPQTISDPYPAVPADLKNLRQWVVWKREERDGKPTKIPYQLHDKNAQSNNPQTWTDYRSVCEHRDRFSGIGFVFSNSDDFTGIDLDNCLENGKVKAWAVLIVERLKDVSYGEISPSDTGIKFWTRANLPANIGHKSFIFDGADDAIEAYDSGRYFTVTGRGKGEIRDGQAVVDWLISEYLKRKPVQSKKSRPPSVPSPQRNESADEIITKIRKSKQCHKFDALMAGNLTGYGSRSEADMALCSVIAFWTQDARSIDAIFRESALYREKWDEKHRSDGATYGEMTIEAVLSGNRTTYTQPRSQRRRRRVNWRGTRRWRS